MANIKITIDGPLMDGHRVTFKAPCDCTTVEQLDVRYVEDKTQVSKLFTMKDAHGNDLTGIGNLFSEGAYVHVILNTTNGFAYIQNADTNGYLENRMSQMVHMMMPDYENNVRVNYTTGVYQAPSDGWLIVCTVGSGEASVNIDGVSVIRTSVSGSFTHQTIVPIGKDQIMTGVNVDKLYFVPCIGASS